MYLSLATEAPPPPSCVSQRLLFLPMLWVCLKQEELVVLVSPGSSHSS